jgi:cysteinyl-tRNA synthetase
MAYPSGDDVYFRVRKQTDYGKLSHRSIDDMKAGARVAISEGKEDPMDFALWKGAKPGEPSWESPWGKGRPGWHIECSAMSYKYLGETIDIHGGGQDLVFPHHENEIAQTEAFTQTIPFSRIWVHNGLLQFAKEKMSKSLGNIISIADALTKVSSDALRLFFLSSHYRNPLLYSDELVLAQEKALDRLRNAMKVHNTNANNHQKEVDPSSYRENFISAMEDDLNTPQALASLFNLAREINRGIKNGSSITLAQSNLSELLNVLGLTLSEQPINESEDKSSMINLLIELRNDLRDAQLYELADKVRKGLASSGISLEDTSDGTKWKIDRK